MSAHPSNARAKPRRRRSGAWALLAVAGVALCGCYQPPPFVCERDGQCDQEGDGVCLQGGCAYAASACPSRFRFSSYAREPNACVPIGTPSADAGRDTR